MLFFFWGHGVFGSGQKAIGNWGVVLYLIECLRECHDGYADAPHEHTVTRTLPRQAEGGTEERIAQRKRE